MADAVEAPPPPHCGGGSGRSSPSPAASPEFEFWMVGKNPSSFPSPAGLLTADELFSGGVVLPLHTLQPSPADGEGEDGDDVEEDEDSAAAPEGGETAEVQQPLADSCPAPTPDLPAVTFKWKDIFKAAGAGGEARDRKKAERRVSSVSGNAELININIWPFSRSRSAGHAAAGAPGSLSRAKPSPNPNPSANASSTASAPAAPAPAPRKVSSAPCSRSNSRGESSGPVPAIPASSAAAAAADAVTAAAQPVPSPATTSMLRRLVPGQGRNNTGVGATTGIRVGRPSPVWQLRRNKLQQATAAEQKQAAGKKKATVPTSTATSDDKDKAAAPGVSSAPSAGCRNNAEGGGEEGSPAQGLLGLRTFFSKKVY